jgi:predicted secreted protein
MGALIRRFAAVIACAALTYAGTAVASAPPVGPLPPGSTTKLTVPAGAVFNIRLPKSKVAGRVWRLARPYNGTLVSQVAEGETSGAVWVRFKARRAGSTLIVYALTRGERSHAYAARRFAVHVVR